MPKSCEVADLAAWVHKMWAFDDRIMPEDTEMARAVRALLEDAATRSVRAVMNGPFVTEREIPAVVARVLGAP
jgi:hypothetical protein